jgi:chloramphenicol-sensitive protein RarD
MSAESASEATAPQAALDRRGLTLGIAAYGLWGLAPLYWGLLRSVDPVEVLAHRIVWGMLAFAVIAALFGAMPGVRRALRERTSLGVLLLTGSLLACNWGVFIWSVVHGRLLESSLGYFINPLVNVLLGTLVLRERLRPGQWFAIALAALGVTMVAARAHGFPWIAIFLACSFGTYGLLRKTARVDALVGSTLETLFLTPLGVAYLLYLHTHGGTAFSRGDLGLSLLVLATGVVTAVPLVWFTASARLLPLAVLGLLQYLSPTGHFLTAVFVFGEPFTRSDLLAFGCIWSGLLVFSFDLWRSARV